MIYVEIGQTLSMDDVGRIVPEYERKYKMSLEEYLDKQVKGNEEKLDKEAKLSEIEDWME